MINNCWKFDLWFLCIFWSWLYIWKLSVHTLLKPSLKDFAHNLASMWNEHNWVTVNRIQKEEPTALCPHLSVFGFWECEGVDLVNKAEIDVFLELSCFFHDPADVGSLMSGSSAFSKTSLNVREFTVHVLLKPGLENFEHYFTSVWDECNCVVVWAFLGIAFLWNWNENCPFPVLWPLLSFPNLLAYWLQHFHSIIFQDLQ